MIMLWILSWEFADVILIILLLKRIDSTPQFLTPISKFLSQGLPLKSSPVSISGCFVWPLMRMQTIVQDLDYCILQSEFNLSLDYS